MEKIFKQLDGVCEKSMRFLGCDTCTIWLYDEKSDNIILRGAAGKHKEGVNKHYYSKGEGLTRHVYDTKKMLILKKCSDMKGIWKGKYIKEIYRDRGKTGGPFLGVPILNKVDAYGVLVFGTDNMEYQYTDDDGMFARIVADTIGLILGPNSKNFDYELLCNLKDKIECLRWDKLRFIWDFSKEIMLCSNAQEIYDKCLGELKKRVSASYIGIYMFNQKGMANKTKSFGSPHHKEFCMNYNKYIDLIGGENYGSSLFLDGFYEDATRQLGIDYDLKGNPDYLLRCIKKNIYAVSLCGLYKIYGYIVLLPNKTDHNIQDENFKDDEKEAIITIASIMSLGILALKREVRANSLFEINKLLNEGDDVEVFNKISKIILNNEECYADCLIRRYDENTDELVLVGSGGRQIKNKDIIKLKADKGIVADVYKKGVYEIVENMGGDSRCVFKDWVRRNGYVSSVIFPLKNINGSYRFGTLSILTKYNYVFGPDDLEYLNRYIGSISGIIQFILDKKEVVSVNDIVWDIDHADSVMEIYGIIDNKIAKSIGYNGCKILEMSDCKGENNEVYYDWISKKKYEVPTTNPVLIKAKNDGHFVNISDVDGNMLCADIKPLLSGVKRFIVRKVNNYSGTLLIIFYDKKKLVDQNVLYQNSFFEAVFRQIDMAISRIKLLEEVNLENIRRLEVGRMINNISETDNIDECLRIIRECIRKIFECDKGYICFFSRNESLVKRGKISYINITADNMPDTKLGKGGIMEIVLRDGKMVSWKKGQHYEKKYIPFKSIEYEIKSEIICPLKYEAVIVGVITIASKREGVYRKKDEEFIEYFAEQVSLIIQNKKFYNATRLLGESGFDIMSKEDICNKLAGLIFLIMEVKYVFVRLIDIVDKSAALKLFGARGVSANEYKKAKAYLFEDKMMMRYINMDGHLNKNNLNRNNEGVCVDCLETICRVGKGSKFYNNSLLIFPVIISGEVLGFVSLYADRGYKIFEKEKVLMKNILINSGKALRNSMLAQRLKESNEQIFETAQLANPGFLALEYIHDVRHIMGRVNYGLSELLGYIDKNLGSDEELESLKELLYVNTDYLSAMFDSIMSYAMKRESKKECHKMAELLEEVTQMYRPLAEMNDIDIKVKYLDRSIKQENVFCDRNQLSQVFVNLFNNSIYAIKKKHAGKGRVVITIKKDIEGFHEISFYDNGVGINEEDVKKVFEIYFTTRSKLGTGFGLAIVKKIVEDYYDGSVTVKSVFGKYARFTVKIKI